jgi:DNA-binding transcriptional regulator YhcF (GntR family)
VIITVEPGSPVPPYEQVRAQLAEAIASGELAVEARLPTVRQLAGDLSLATNTVARSYRELEAAGLIETRGRHGSYVAPKDTGARREAVRATRDFTAAMRRLGVGSEELVALVRQELAGDATGGSVAGAHA